MKLHILGIVAVFTLGTATVVPDNTERFAPNLSLLEDVVTYAHYTYPSRQVSYVQFFIP